jgi:hypothetical protein
MAIAAHGRRMAGTIVDMVEVLLLDSVLGTAVPVWLDELPEVDGLRFG